MKKAYLTLIKNTLSKDLTISVWDGEEWQVKRSNSYQAIKDAIESVEVAEIRIRDKDKNVLAWAQIVPDLDPEETVADYTDSQLMADLLEEEYQA
jgi:dTDP-4-amino-4,6-dideoxygalactose transaminase